MDPIVKSDQLHPILSGVIYALSTMLAFRDPFVAGHQQRVANIAYEVGKKMRLCEDKLIGLRIAGLLHDVGKACVPVEILSKPGKITAAEFAVIKDHAWIGYEILKSIRFSWPVAQVALQHHERLNGTGYPKGLTGNKILLETKIITVCDVFEAMTTNRAYRPALPKEVAFKELNKNKGIFYDIDVVKILLSLAETDILS